MAVFDDRDASHYHYMQTTSLVHYAGALVSLALVAGVSLWGYQLIVRDVSGIPVVRAAEGAMRVAPQDAGGEVAEHAGLSVNAVSGDGAAAGPSDSLLLAPQSSALAEEDLRVEPLAEADEVMPAADAAPLEQETPAVVDLTMPGDEPATGPRTEADALALVDELVGSEAPMSALPTGETQAPTVSLDGTVIGAPEVIDPTIPGVTVSLRPSVRPDSLSAPATAEAAPAIDTTAAVAAALAEATAAAAPLPAGTHLVQLGAFPTVDDAVAEWTRINSLFPDFMRDKDRVIQEASAGGSTFFRLRAGGFAEATAARRFCETLKAGNAECTPVVLR